MISMFNCREELAESHLHVSYFQWEGVTILYLKVEFQFS